jgi:hypothetical protein
LLLPADGYQDFPVGLVIKEPINSLSCGKSSKRVLLVLSDAKLQIARYSDIKRAADASDNVNRITMLAAGRHSSRK